MTDIRRPKSQSASVKGRNAANIPQEQSYKPAHGSKQEVLMSHSWSHQTVFSCRKAATERQKTGFFRTRETFYRRGLTQNTSGHQSSIIMPPWSQHCSQAALLYETSVHPPNRDINNKGKWLSWFHCTFDEPGGFPRVHG